MFENREEAGILLANKLKSFKNKKGMVVLGITRGGVVVAKEIANGLNLPLHVLVVKKIGAPKNPELAIGAVGPKETVYWDKKLCQELGLSEEQKEQELEKKKKEQKDLQRRLEKFSHFSHIGGDIASHIGSQKVILVDDGIATGATVLAAQKYLVHEKVKSIILATPVISKDTLRDIKNHFDTIIALEIPSQFHAVGEFYSDFPQVDDKSIRELLYP